MLEGCGQTLHAQVKRDRRRRVPTTPEMCFLASRLEAGAVTAAELKLADKLVMALVDRLPPRRRMEARPALL